MTDNRIEPCICSDDDVVNEEDEDLDSRIRREALETLEVEPELSPLLHNTVLAPDVQTFEDAVAHAIAFRLLDSKQNATTTTSTNSSSQDSNSCTTMLSSSIHPDDIRKMFLQAVHNTELLEGGNTMSYAIRQDVLAVLDRDPACKTILEVVLFFKGFAALVGHRVARQKWIARPHSMVALFLQSACSAAFGMDIHPGATIGAGTLLDHGTGIVIGETAVIEDGSTLLHGVTLGGTGKESGDRHPKIGPRCFIGAGASILGNIQIGAGCKIGAGSIVLRALPAGATAVGAPAKIIGRAKEENPARNMDRSLSDVQLLHKSQSMQKLHSEERASSNVTESTEEETSFSSGDDFDDNDPLAGANDDGCNQNRCPFREYTRFAKRSPPGSITIVTLRKLLLPEGCSQDEIGSLFFNLDQDNVGHIHRQAFEQIAPEAIPKYTSLKDPEQCQVVLTKFFANHREALEKGDKRSGSLSLSN